MANTTNLALPELDQGQKAADVTHNEALNILDNIVQCAVEDMTRTAPPAGVEGNSYIPLATATGAWAGWENNIVAYVNGSWIRIIQATGWTIYDKDTVTWYSWSGAAWIKTKMEPEVLDTEFRVVKSTDSTSKMDFDMSKVATATTTTFIMPNGDVEFAKTKLDATAAPTVNNDVDEDYEPGSIWVDLTGDKAYLCVDNTDGAAIWREMAGATGTGDVSTTGTAVDNVIVRYHTTTGDDIQPSGITITDNDELYGNFALVLEKSAAYTLTGADSGKLISVTSGTFNITLPQTSTETIAVGAQWTVINRGSGTVSIVKEGTDVIESKDSLVDIGQHGVASIIKLDDTTVNTYGLYGDLE